MEDTRELGNQLSHVLKTRWPKLYGDFAGAVGSSCYDTLYTVLGKEVMKVVYVIVLGGPIVAEHIGTNGCRHLLLHPIQYKPYW